MGDRGHNRHGSKRAGDCYAPFAEAGTQHNTMWPGPRPTYMLSAILIHLAVLPQKTWAKNWGLRPLFGEGLGPHLSRSSSLSIF